MTDYTRTNHSNLNLDYSTSKLSNKNESHRNVVPEVDEILFLAGHTFGHGGRVLFVGLPKRNRESFLAFAEQPRLVRTEQPDLPLLGGDGGAVVELLQTLDAVSLLPFGTLLVRVFGLQGLAFARAQETDYDEDRRDLRREIVRHGE